MEALRSLFRHEIIYWIAKHRLFARSRAPHDPVANRFSRCSRVRHRIALFRSGVARSRERYFFLLFFLFHRLEQTVDETQSDGGNERKEDGKDRGKEKARPMK